VPLSAEDRARVKSEVELMVAEYRAKPTAEKEDVLGLRIATMPAAERDHVPTVLLEVVAAESRRRS
jgi:hypothetical protein